MARGVVSKLGTTIVVVGASVIVDTGGVTEIQTVDGQSPLQLAPLHV